MLLGTGATVAGGVMVAVLAAGLAQGLEAGAAAGAGWVRGVAVVRRCNGVCRHEGRRQMCTKMYYCKVCAAL